jgi:PhnB protein
MAHLNPHINFNGNDEEAFHFYRSAFGGEFSKIIRFREIASEAYPVLEKEADKLMHIALPIGNSVLMANDIPESMGRVNERENRSKISVSAETFAEATKLFKGLSVGAEVEIPPTENPDEPFYAMFRDKYGIEWIVEIG